MSSQASATAQARHRWIPAVGAAALPPAPQRLQLSRVLGHSASGSQSAAYNPVQSSQLAYVAGSVLVLYDQRADEQKRLMVGRRGRELAAVSWSAEGEWIVAAERGNNAAVIIFNAATGAKIATIVGHTGSVTTAKMSPLKDFIAVVSDEQTLDGVARSNVGLWRVSDQQLVWSHTCEQVFALDWSADNAYFVMCGKHFMRFAYLRGPAAHSSTSLNADPAYARPLLDVEVREGRLVKNEKAEFVAVVCGQGALAHCVFALSKHGQGVVCVFTLKEKGVGSSAEGRVSVSGGSASGVTSRWEIEKWMDVRMPDAAVLAVRDDVLAVGGGEAKLRVFVASSLKHVDTLPKPAPLFSDRKVFPALVAATLCPGSTKLAAVYSDRTLTVWDIAKKPATIFRTFQGHAGPVWGLALPPAASAGAAAAPKRRRAFHDIDYDSEEEEAAAAETAKRNEGRLPDGAFATCGADNTIRLWNSLSTSPSSDCIRTVYVAPVHNGPPQPHPLSTAPRGGQGLRCLRFLPARESFSQGLLASGDKSGYVRLHNLADWKQLSVLEIHDSEVKCLDFHSAPAGASGGGNGVLGLPLLLSGGRDTTVHVHNTHDPVVPQTYTPDVVHAAAVTAVKLLALPAAAPAPGGTGAAATERLVYLTAGLDKQLVIHSLSLDSSDSGAADSVQLASDVLAVHTFPSSCALDMAVHPTGQFVAVLLNNTEKKAQAAAAAAAAAASASGSASGGSASRLDSRPVNCVIQMIDLTSLAKSRSYSIQSLGSGEPLCMALDPSGMLLAVAFSDKAVLLVDWYSGAVLASVHAHAQGITALAWTQDCRHLVSTARDGCVFVWKVDQEFSRAMIQRRRELRPVSAGSAATAAGAGAKKKESASAPKSTALALLGSSDEEEEEEESEGDSEKDEKESAVGAAASAVPPLSNGGSSPRSSASASAAAGGGGGALSYRPRVLPSWARSTVVSPEGSGSPTELALAAQQLLPSGSGGVSVGPGLGFGLGLGAGGVERSSSLAAGPANPITGTGSGSSGSSGVVARGRWAQRIEVDSSGNPIVPVADVSTHKVYGELGTIGVGTMLLDADGDDDADGAEGGAPGSTGSARVSRDEADHEGDDEEEEIEEEDDLSSGEEESEASAEAVVAPEDLSAAGGGVNLRSSLTARHFQKLRDEGKMPGGGGGGAGAAGVKDAQQRRDALFRLPQSFHEREAKTTTETREIRAQLRSMGVLDGEGGAAASPNPVSAAAAPSVDQPASASASVAAATATSAPALSPSAPAKLERAESDTSTSLEGSSQSQFVSAESEPSSAMEHAQIPFSNSLTKALPPLPTSPEPPASSSSGSVVAAVPQLGSPPRAHSQQSQSQSQSQSLATADPTLRASMQALPSQIAQFQSSLQRMLEGFGAVRHALDARPASDVSASSSSSSSAMVRASSARPTLPPASIQSVSVSLSFSSNANASSSGGAGRNAPPSATLPFVSPEALEAAMDLDTLEAVYEAQLDTMEALLAQARPQRRMAAQQQQQQQQLLVGTSQGQAGGAALMLMSGSDSPSPLSQHHTFLTEATMSPSQQALTLQQSAAITAQLSEMKQMLQRIEATTLSTTQQLSLGLTLSGPNSLPTNAFSRADSK